MPDEVEIQVVDGDEDDPFTQQADPLASVAASEGDAEEDGQDVEDGAQSAVTSEDDGTGDEFTDEELVALEELAAWQKEQAAATAEQSVSKLQSKYDRQLAAQERQMRALTEAAQAREQELLVAVREAKLNGLSDAEKEQLKSRWDEEDRVAKLNAYEQQLTGFHIDILRTAYVTEFAEFGLQEGDLDSFDTPEEMEDFVKDVQIEYYKLMADPRVQAAIAAEEAPVQVAPAPAPAPAARRAPAGANAPTDAGGGSAPAPTPKFNKGTGVEAMADNIRGGWETTRVR